MFVLMHDHRPVSPVEIADTWASRARGMLWRRELPEALLLRPCNSVHGAGMRVPLDVAFLAADGHVLETLVLRPWAITRPRRHAAAVLEAPTGSFARWGLSAGSVIRIDDDNDPPEPWHPRHVPHPARP